MISLPSRYLVTTPTGISPLLFLLRNFPPLFIVRLSLHGVTSHGIRGTGSIVDIHFSFFLFSSQQTKSNRFIFASFKTRWKDSLNPFSSKKFLYLRKEREREREKMKIRTISHANHDARPGSVKTSYLERFRSAARDRDFHESRYTCPYSGGGFQWPRLNPRRYHWTAQMRRDSKRYQGSCHVEHVHPMHNHA